MPLGDVSKCIGVLALCFAAAVAAQSVEKEGKAWLAARSEAAEINIGGTWRAGTWGPIVLNQREGGREVTGTGDDWEILGVVSGKKVCLLFSHKGRIAYSAELTPEDSNSLNGVYSDGLLTAKSKTRLMHMSR